VGKILKDNTWFLAPWAVVAAVVLAAVSVYGRGELHLAVNKLHVPAADVFFRYLTWFGNGWAVLILVVFLSFIKLRNAVLVFASFGISGIITQLMKHLVFPGAQRPVEYLSGHDLHLVPGVKLLHDFSFPSGHSATAFAVFLVLSHLVPSRCGKFLCFLAATLVAWSRIYLSQHFTGDVLAGSLIGVITGILCLSAGERIKNGWSDKALLSLILKSGTNEDGR
jgi:membrane-associated phospholipid phosphatase